MTTSSGPTGSAAGVQGITEADIANYLAQTPGFFERHAELLSTVQLTSPHGPRALRELAPIVHAACAGSP